MIKINKRILQFSIKEDRAILLVCMGIAFVFWLLVKLSQPYKTTKSVLIETQIDNDMAFVKLPPQNLNVELEGTGWDLIIDYFYRSSVQLNYNLQSRNNLSLNKSQLRADIKTNLYSNDLKVIDVNYENLNLVLEKKASKRVPVILRDSFSFAPEYQLKEQIKLIPDSITIVGAESMVATVEQWSTNYIFARNVKNSFTKDIELESPPPELSLSEKSISVMIEVEPFTEKSMYVPIIIENAPDSIRIFPEKVSVSCKVGLSKYDSVTYRSFVAIVDMKGITPNSPNNTVPIIIAEKPKYVRGMQYRPKSAKFFYVEE